MLIPAMQLAAAQLEFWLRVNRALFPGWSDAAYPAVFDHALAIVRNYLLLKRGSVEDSQLVQAAKVIVQAHRMGIERPIQLADRAIVTLEANEHH